MSASRINRLRKSNLPRLPKPIASVKLSQRQGRKSHPPSRTDTERREQIKTLKRRLRVKCNQFLPRLSPRTLHRRRYHAKVLPRIIRPDVEHPAAMVHHILLLFHSRRNHAKLSFRSVG